LIADQGCGTLSALTLAAAESSQVRAALNKNRRKKK
jgi:hypothetical protein